MRRFKVCLHGHGRVINFNLSGHPHFAGGAAAVRGAGRALVVAVLNRKRYCARGCMQGQARRHGDSEERGGGWHAYL